MNASGNTSRQISQLTLTARLGSVLLLMVCGLSTSNAAAESAPSEKEQERFFEQKVRPILAEHCFSCHGAKKQEAGLRLDARDFVLKGSEDGPVIVSKRPEASRLIEAVRYSNEDFQMPPNGKLEPDQIAALETWVKLGLPWPAGSGVPVVTSNEIDFEKARKSHWSFRPVVKPKRPSVKNGANVVSEIDRFIVAKLEARGLDLSPRADRRTLIRRATFDLIGLPPTPEEVTTFIDDDSPDAFSRLIDRLLASPHYGERWGRYWLDVARYADNKGYVFFEEKKFPWAYTYRDYVIRAFNDDLPYDRFVLEQLAADQLDLGADKSSLAAMGFLTLGARFMNNVHDILDDRIDVVTRGLMGLTVTCARCHAHKFDPIPQEDYYSLYGVFRSSFEPMLPPMFETPPATEEYNKFDTEMKKRMNALNEFVGKKHRDLVQSSRKRAAEYIMAAYEAMNQPSVENFMLLTTEGSLNPSMITRWTIYLKKTLKDQHPVWTIWHRFAAIPEKEFAARAAEVCKSLAEDLQSKASINRLMLAEFVEKPPASLQEVADRYGVLFNRIDTKWQELLKQATASKQSLPGGLSDRDEEELRRVFYGANAPPDVPVVFGWGFLDLLPDRPSQGVYKKLVKEIETWSMTGAGAPPRAMVLFDSDRPYAPKVFRRGNPNRPGDSVPRQFLGIAAGLNRKPFSQGSGRLELAKAIVDPANPLTARVIVNRIWQHHFGNGLVQTPSDFGLRSEPPTHPQLLDWLAATFVVDGWSIKQLHKRIMQSAAYRQQSHSRAKCESIDPTNRLLWKMNRSRLDFESTRDSLIAVTGNLDRTIGGPPIDVLKAGFLPRRTLYGFVDRLDLPGLYRSFDFPSPASSSPGRELTTIPPQALFLMNNPFMTETARRVLRRLDVSSQPDVERKVQRIYKVLFSRKPTESEWELAAKFLDSESSPTEIWMQFTQALLMTNEFVTVD